MLQFKGLATVIVFLNLVYFLFIFGKVFWRSDEEYLHIHDFFYKKNVYKKMSLKKTQNLKKMLRKPSASNPWAASFKNVEIF